MLREIALLGRALSHPLRLRILKLLSQQDLCVGQLVYLLAVQQSRVSQNLSILKYANFVTDSRCGRLIFYSLNRPAFEQALQNLRSFMGEPSLAGIADMQAEERRWLRMPTSLSICKPNAATDSVLHLPRVVDHKTTSQRRRGQSATRST